MSDRVVEPSHGRPDRHRLGPAALVTGASDGIGEACARHLAARSVDLILVARRRERLEALAQDLSGAHAIDVTVIDADLGRPEDVAQVIARTRHHDIGLLVAAAGFGSSGPFLDQPVDAELDMVDVNCRAVVALAHAIGSRLVARGRGGIVLFSSIVAFQGVPRQATYAASKAFVQSLAEGLRTEFKPRGVDVLAVAPGPVATGFAARAGMSMGAADTSAAVAAAALDALGRTTTVRPGRLGKLLGFALSTLPRRGRVLVMTHIMRGMTRARASSTAPAAPRPPA